jgi:hypothetical protein
MKNMSEGMEFYKRDNREKSPENEMVIDNGEDRIMIKIDKVRSELAECGINDDNIEKMINRVRKFSEEVEKEKKNDEHLGSSNLQEAVYSLFLPTGEDQMELDPLDFQTETEQKLAAKVFEKNCVIQSIEKLDIGEKL